MFLNGKRLKEYSTKIIPALSGKLIPEFDRRRNIRDMFARKPAASSQSLTATTIADAGDSECQVSMKEETIETAADDADNAARPSDSEPVPAVSTSPKAMLTGRPSSITKTAGTKRASDTATNRSLKRSKSGPTSTAPVVAVKGQQSLKGFFKARPPPLNSDSLPGVEDEPPVAGARGLRGPTAPSGELATAEALEEVAPCRINIDTAAVEEKAAKPTETSSQPVPPSPATASPAVWEDKEVIDPIVSKESWSQLFSKPAAPRCEGHNEPCISLTTKKPGVNCGRVFWICPRLAAPSPF